MELLQIITLFGIALVVVAAIVSYLYSRKQNLKVQEENLKSVTAQVAQYLETPIEETPKAKKKRKYYPRKPKTQA
jgi:nicotinamide mononucleotide (NMN) deamidase PncC